MSRVLGLVCIFAMVAMATPCCLPDQASFDWKLDMNYTSPFDDTPRQATTSGSAAFDLNKQLLFIQIDDLMYSQKVVLNLGKKHGSAVAELTRGGPVSDDSRKSCYGSNVTGSIGKPWRCVLDNTNVFTKVDGEAGYLLFIPGLIYGPVSLQKDVCLPQSGDFEITGINPEYQWTATVRFEASNMREKVDASVFEDPCKPDPTRSHPGNNFEIPTPDEMVQMILSSTTSATGGPTPFTTPTYTGTTDVSGNPSFDTTTSPATEETATGGPTPFTTPTYTGTTDVSGNPSFDTTTSPAPESDSDEAESEEGSDEEDEDDEENEDEEADSTEASDETRRRRCIIPGAICY